MYGSLHIIVYDPLQPMNLLFSERTWVITRSRPGFKTFGNVSTDREQLPWKRETRHSGTAADHYGSGYISRRELHKTVSEVVDIGDE